VGVFTAFEVVPKSIGRTIYGPNTGTQQATTKGSARCWRSKVWKTVILEPPQFLLKRLLLVRAVVYG
jgi:hypothetical protein